MISAELGNSTRGVGPARVYRNLDQDTRILESIADFTRGTAQFAPHNLSLSNIRRQGCFKWSVLGFLEARQRYLHGTNRCSPQMIHASTWDKPVKGYHLNAMCVEILHAVGNGCCEMRSGCFANHATSTLVTTRRAYGESSALTK